MSHLVQFFQMKYPLYRLNPKLKIQLENYEINQAESLDLISTSNYLPLGLKIDMKILMEKEINFINNNKQLTLLFMSCLSNNLSGYIIKKCNDKAVSEEDLVRFDLIAHRLNSQYQPNCLFHIGNAYLKINNVHQAVLMHEKIRKHGIFRKDQYSNIFNPFFRKAKILFIAIHEYFVTNNNIIEAKSFLETFKYIYPDIYEEHIND
ncbi:MAG: hypothetical protein JXA94_03025 [Parachlamydiales bacterium]|nr:hypothetical protein [Parachlamydiales bacterium]